MARPTQSKSKASRMRLKRHLTLKQVCTLFENSKMTPPMLSRRESGKTPFKIEELYQLAKIYHCKVEELI